MDILDGGYYYFKEAFSEDSKFEAEDIILNKPKISLGLSKRFFQPSPDYILKSSSIFFFGSII